jgi:hypothetical protein
MSAFASCTFGGGIGVVLFVQSWIAGWSCEALVREYLLILLLSDVARNNTPDSPLIA